MRERYSEDDATHARRATPRFDPRFDWDVRLGRCCVLLLLTGYLIPVVVGLFGETLWIWPWTGWGNAALFEILLGLLPVIFGAASWVLLGLDRRRLRGALLFVLSVAALLIPLGWVVLALGGMASAWDAFLRFGWQGLAVMGGSALVAAGNRQQKRSLGSGPAPWVAAVGGLAVLAVFIVPLFASLAAPESHVGIVAAEFLGESDVWARLWYVWVWLLGLIAFGLLGAASPLTMRLGDGLHSWVERAISRLARVLPLSLPLTLLVGYAVEGLPGLGYFSLLVMKATLHTYAVLLLMAVGMARLLDDAVPGTVRLDTDEPAAREAGPSIHAA